MPEKITGLHHITAVSGPPDKNVEFYSGDLGLRFTKKTVNFDDPFTYHLYYGNYDASPGSAITFFPWVHSVQGSPNTGEATVVQYSVPGGSVDYWKNRLEKRGIHAEGPVDVFGNQSLKLNDNDGMMIELVFNPETDTIKTKGYGGVPDDKAIRGFFGTSLSLADTGPTAELLEEFGWEKSGEERDRIRYFSKPDNKLGGVVDLIEQPGLQGRFGKGSVHHVAFRVPDEEVQQEWRETLIKMGYSVTPVKDRVYFRSIYFREPGGVLFEFATDGPGFTKDESIESLGEKLTLPPWYEQHRDQIEQKLPPLHDRKD